MTRQLDLFGESQPELPGVETAAAVYRADPDEVRAELLRVLAKVRAAQSFSVGRAPHALLAHGLSADDQLAAGRGGRAVAFRVRGGNPAAGSGLSLAD